MLDALAGLPDLTLTGVLARRTGSAAGFIDDAQGATVPQAVAYASLDALAADPAVDFVILTTPPERPGRDRRGRWSRAGKPILMEKPVERDLTARHRASSRPARPPAFRSASCCNTAPGPPRSNSTAGCPTSARSAPPRSRCPGGARKATTTSPAAAPMPATAAAC